MFDFVRLTGIPGLIDNHHIKFGTSEDQLESTPVFWKSPAGLEQHNVFHHPSLHIFKDTLTGKIPFSETKRGKERVFHQYMYQRLRLRIAHTRLRKDHVFRRCTAGSCRFRRKIHHQIKRFQIFFDFFHVGFCNADGLIFTITDLQHFHQLTGNGFPINTVQNIGPLFRIRLLSEKLSCRAEIM